MSGSSPTPAPRGLSLRAGAGASSRAFLAVALSAGLTACVEKGDFGRPRAGAWNDIVLLEIGLRSARLRGEAVSGFPLTDAEGELRDRSWRFLMPAHERSHFDALMAQLVRTRILPPRADASEEASYHRALMRTDARSPASRFRRVGEDASADAVLVGPFAAVAARVLAADNARLRALTYIDDIADREIADAVARVAENRCLIAWVRETLGQRIESYTHAAQHGFVATPQEEAIGAERAIAELRASRLAMDSLGVPSWRNGACLKPALQREGRRAVVVKA